MNAPLAGTVAVVAGAAGGPGAGWRGRSPYNRPDPWTIVAAGGSAVAVRVDHTVESEAEALFHRVDEPHGRLGNRSAECRGSAAPVAQVPAQNGQPARTEVPGRSRRRAFWLLRAPPLGIRKTGPDMPALTRQEMLFEEA